MVAAAGAGPKPIHHKALNSENLAEAIKYCLSPEASKAAQTMSAQIQTERGVRQAVESFHNQLDSFQLGCHILPNQPAVWRYKSKSGTVIKLSKLAAEILVDTSRIERNDLKP